MLDVFNFASPQTANYQEFYGGGTVRDWVKPRGVSMVRMLLIGAGGGGSGGGVGTTNGCNGGGSGAVTEWVGPAIFIPDILRVSLGAGGAGGAGSTTTTINAGTTGGATSVVYQQKDGTGYTLLTANGGGAGGTGTTVGTGGAVFTNNFFGASGIFSSTAGQSNTRSVNITGSTTIFLTAGATGATGTNQSGYSVVPLYGYPTVFLGDSTGTPGGTGYFITSPIMLGAGGAGGGSPSTGAGAVGGRGGIGCGGGGGARGVTTGGTGGRGGDGAVFIWAW